MSVLIIRDGYTATKSFDAVPGLFPACVVKFRPALSAKRDEYRKALEGKNIEKTSEWRAALVASHVVDFDGSPLTRDDSLRLTPMLYDLILDLVLGYTAADELDDVKN